MKKIKKYLSLVIMLSIVANFMAQTYTINAAPKPKLNSTKEILDLSGYSGPCEFDFNVLNKISGSIYNWSSDNKNVAVVDSSTGLTSAVGIGTAKINVVIKNKTTKKVVANLSASVMVRDNIQSLETSFSTNSDELYVNQDIDFDYSFTTDAGSTIITSSIVRWVTTGWDSVTNGASINDAGVFNASEPGEYLIIANAFESTSTYNKWIDLDDPMASDYVVTSAQYTITIVKPRDTYNSTNNTTDNTDTTTNTNTNSNNDVNNEVIKQNYYNSLTYATSMGSAVYPLVRNQFIKTPRDNKTDTWYKIDVKEGDGITIVLKPQIDKDSMHLYLYDSSGASIKSAAYIYDGNYGVVSKKDISYDQTMYVKVTGAVGNYYIGFYDQYYSNDSSINDERDFFGSLNTAKKLISNVITVTHSDKNLDDYYRIDLKEGQTLSVSITPQIDKDSMHLYLYDSEASALSNKSYIYNGKVGTVSKKASRDCTYFIRVSGTSGKYELSYIIY